MTEEMNDTKMMSLFDEEQIMKSFIRSERHDADRETAEIMQLA